MNDDKPARAFTLNEGYFFDAPELGPLSQDLEHQTRAVLGDIADVAVRGIWVSCMPIGVHRLALPTNGWKIHVSVKPGAAGVALKALYESWLERPFPFKHLRDSALVTASVSRWWPRGSSGKTIVIYPRDATELEELLATSADLVRDYAGADVLTSRKYAPGVFYRFGGITLPAKVDDEGHVDWQITGPNGQTWDDDRRPSYRLPPWIIDPIDPPPASRTSGATPLLNERFHPLAAIRHSTAGGVYRGIDDRATEVVIKEARPGTAVGDDGLDAADRVKREATVLRQLSGISGIPEVVDLFEQGGHTFLVTKRIDAIPLQTYVARSHPLAQGLTLDEDIATYRTSIAEILLNLRGVVAELHRAGLCHGDLSLTNVLVHPPTGTTYLTDFEATRPLDEPHDNYPRTLGFSPQPNTPGWQNGQTFDDFSLMAIEWACIFPRNGLLNLDPATYLRQLQVAADALGWELNEAETHLHQGTVRSTTKHLVTDVIAGLTRGITEHSTPERSDRLFPADPELFRTNPLNVQNGAAGVLRALKAVEAPVSDEMRTWFRQCIHRQPPTPPGLWSGWAGIGITCFDLGEVELGHIILRGLPDPDSYQTGGLAVGASGVGLALLRAWEMTSDRHYLDRAVHFGRNVTARMKHRRDNPDESSDSPVGYGYGPSGAAVFLASLCRATQDSQWLTSALTCLRDDLNVAVDRPNGGIGFPTRAGRHTLEPYLGKGGAGVGYALATLHRIDATPELSDYLSATILGVTVGATTNPGLTTGAAGVLAFLRRANQTLGTAYDEAFIRASIESMLIHTNDVVLCPGNGLTKCSLDYATGSAGLLELLANEPSQTSPRPRWNTELWPTE